MPLCCPCFSEKNKYNETNSLLLERKYLYCFLSVCVWGGEGNGLVTVLKIVQGNKIAEQNSSIFSRIYFWISPRYCRSNER